ncbi:MAG: type II toxin-antitoxin system RelE/ParE family toxin [Rhodoplanes sp.]|uniref:type II toxin-antitoxin system RelE/ParE family toxin n=1 Tax=Rhodoplanes sp. TaxID=1968906 RepID=UPI0017F0EC2D|nr:type II toxin-antitoxin system RelE/ParE family toxin [Rhodoplanes sp.]NVO17604.1 type II toxin-antitoxin system RelE/ParE family toxin [Rhodoplanes sp.]
MIESFRHKGLKRLFEDGDPRGVNAQHVDKIEMILGLLDVALTVEDLNLPSFRLHRLTGDLKGLWSVTVRANWRIVFRFDDGRAFDVDLVDYH